MIRASYIRHLSLLVFVLAIASGCSEKRSVAPPEASAESTTAEPGLTDDMANESDAPSE